MFTVLLGGKGAMQHLHALRACRRLARAIEPESPAVSFEAQQEAADFLHGHGTRATVRLARSIERRR